MARIFITKADITRMLEEGQDTLTITPQHTVTDMALEYARSRGMRVVRSGADETTPAADRTESVPAASSVLAPGACNLAPTFDHDEIDVAAIRAAVCSQLGEVPAELDDIITKVLSANG